MEASEIIIVIVGGTLIMAVLVIFIISFFFVHQRRQQAHRLEKANLQARFEQESLHAKNEIQENTMRLISRELHDNVGQLLSLVKIQLNALDENPSDEKRIKNSKEYLNQAFAGVRELSKALNSENILAEGISKAIEFELARVEQTGLLKTIFDNRIQAFRLNPKTELIVFRIFQECLQNILKHSKAKILTVNLFRSTENYILKIQDDGIGFDVSAVRLVKGFQAGAGLANMKSRAELISGGLAIASVVGEGTTITLNIPYDISFNDKRSPN